MRCIKMKQEEWPCFALSLAFGCHWSESFESCLWLPLKRKLWAMPWQWSSFPVWWELLGYCLHDPWPPRHWRFYKISVLDESPSSYLGQGFSEFFTIVLGCMHGTTREQAGPDKLKVWSLYHFIRCSSSFHLSTEDSQKYEGLGVVTKGMISRIA